MSEKENPCLICYFDWKDYCDDERREICIKVFKEMGTVEQFKTNTNKKRGK